MSQFIRRILTNNILVNFNKTLDNQILRTYAFKSDLKIKWVRPEKIPFYKPEKSGDLESLPKIDLNQPQLEFRNSKELADADDVVKRLFSLQFARRNKTMQVYTRQMVLKVQRHKYDISSVETTLAKWTGVIRAWQEIMERFPRNKKFKVRLKELIDKRKKHLKYLRRWDYKRFEWLLEQLNLVYKPMPLHVQAVTRKESLRKLTNTYCEDIKIQRLEEYKLKLEDEQPAFLEEKINSLEFIRNEQKECGEQETVTQEEINEVRQQLAELQLRNKENKEKNNS